MTLVDAKYSFIWGSCGFPGNSHDSTIQEQILFSGIGKVGVCVSNKVSYLLGLGEQKPQYPALLHAFQPFTSSSFSGVQQTVHTGSSHIIHRGVETILKVGGLINRIHRGHG